MVEDGASKTLASSRSTSRLPYEGVEISRHHRYELEANIFFDDELQFHIPNPDWKRTVLPYCPDGDDLSIVNDVFPVTEFPAE